MNINKEIKSLIKEVARKSLENEHSIVATCKDCKKDYKIKCTYDQLMDFIDGDRNIQEIFPNISVDERELLISGICGKCFDKIFGEDEWHQ